MSEVKALPFEPNHEDIQSLLGAYALDAVDDGERRRVDQHLRGCEECREEASDHLEVAGLLTLVLEMEGEAETEDPPPVVSLEAERDRRRPAMAQVLSVAAALVLLVGFVVQTARLGQVRSQLQAASVEDVAAALAADGSLTFGLTDGEGQEVATVVLLDDGTGLLTIEGLPAVDEGRTYQLWGVMDGEVVSVGLAGDGPGTSAFTADGERLEALVLTEEEAGGVAVSEADPVALVSISS